MIEKQSKFVIVGAGFAGIATAITLKSHFECDDFVIYDRNEDVGGTWHSNTYPGCASDVPAPWYSLSSDLNPNWTRLMPYHSEMKQYLKDVCSKYNFDVNIRTNCTVDCVRWDEQDKKWNLTVDSPGKEQVHHVADFVFICQGILVEPNEVDFPGLKENFKGDWFHTGHWNHDVSLENKKVIVVGNGCSAAQVVPNIVDQCESVTQVIRSKHWLYPPVPKGVFDSFQNYYSKSDFKMRVLRGLMFFSSEMKAPLFNSSNWLSGMAEKYYENKARTYIQNTAPEKFHDLLIPDFKFGCKRTIFDNPGYCSSLHNEKIELIKDKIKHIDEHNVYMESGASYEADVIIAATGYDVKKSIYNTQIIGRNESLKEKWSREGISAYETLLVDDFPNLALIGGPNVATGHSSVVFAVENSQLFVKQVLKPIINNEATTMEVKSEAYQSWKTTIQHALSRAVFSSPLGGCTSWYAKPGETNFTTYPWTQLTFWWRMWNPNWRDLVYS